MKLFFYFRVGVLFYVPPKWEVDYDFFIKIYLSLGLITIAFNFGSSFLFYLNSLIIEKFLTFRAFKRSIWLMDLLSFPDAVISVASVTVELYAQFLYLYRMCSSVLVTSYAVDLDLPMLWKMLARNWNYFFFVASVLVLSKLSFFGDFTTTSTMTGSAASSKVAR